MPSSRTAAPAGGGLLLLAIVVLVLALRWKGRNDRRLPGVEPVTDAADSARAAAATTIDKAGGLVHDLWAGAGELLGDVDASQAVDRLEQALEEVRAALARAVPVGSDHSG